MSQTALELLLRVAGERLVSEPCARCGAALEGAAVRLCDQAPDRVVLEVLCRACAHATPIEITPEARQGSADLESRESRLRNFANSAESRESP